MNLGWQEIQDFRGSNTDVQQNVSQISRKQNLFIHVFYSAFIIAPRSVFLAQPGFLPVVSDFLLDSSQPDSCNHIAQTRNEPGATRDISFTISCPACCWCWANNSNCVTMGYFYFHGLCIFCYYLYFYRYSIESVIFNCLTTTMFVCICVFCVWTSTALAIDNKVFLILILMWNVTWWVYV